MPQDKPVEYPLPAFHFRVAFSGSGFKDRDTSFQEVSGIGYEVEYENIVEGGKLSAHRLPKAIKYPLLSLKRGIADKNSPLVKWCREIMESDFEKRIKPMGIKVFLLNEKGNPVRGWSFENTYPVKWDIESFGATKNEVAIEKIELSYDRLKKII